MAIFSRHKQVLEADGSPMTVRAALQLINEVLDEYLASGEGDFDADTRFAITWYEQHGWEPGPFGDAETLAKARNVSVSGVVEAGICKSAAGKVRILKRHEMRPLDYDPAQDERPTVWEFTQHMIRNLEDEGEEAAARLLKKLGGAADATRELAYRLYNTCERKKWAEDARSYNALILAWTELEKLAAKMGDEPPPAAPSNGAKGKRGASSYAGPARRASRATRSTRGAASPRELRAS
jgi:putative DNA methylase